MSSGPARRALAFAPLALVLSAAAAVALSSRVRMPLPPPGWIGASVAVLAVAALFRSGTPRIATDLPVAALFGVAAQAAHLVPGLVLGTDTLHHVWGAWAYLQAWSAGDFFPLWLHHLGLGMPMPLFYGPLPFWAMAPFAFAGLGPAHLVSGSFVLAGVAAATAAWAAVASWTGDRRAALVAALAWSYAPYRLLDANYRFALGEAWALAVLPLVLVSFDRLLMRGGSRWLAAAAASLALLAVAHPLSLVPGATSLLVLFAARAPRFARRRAVGRAIGRSLAAGALAAALAGFFLLPLAAELASANVLHLVGGAAAVKAGSLQGEPPTYHRHGVRPAELVDRGMTDVPGWSLPEDAPPGGLVQMPFYFGLVLLAGIGGAAIAGRSSSGDEDSPLLPLAVVAIVDSALALRPLAHLLSGVAPIALLEFPWRFLGPASGAAALALGCLAARSLPLSRRPVRLGWLVASALALAALGDGFARSGALGRVEPWRGAGVLREGPYATGVVHVDPLPEPWPLRVFGIFVPPWFCCAEFNEVYTAYPEYFTVTARRTAVDFRRSSIDLVMKARGLVPSGALPYARAWTGDRADPRELEFRRAGGRIDVELADGVGGRVEVAEQYFPGWQVERDGSWREVVPTADGLLQAEVPAGATTIRFRFDRWRWDRSVGWLLTLATAGALALLLRRGAAARAGAAP